MLRLAKWTLAIAGLVIGIWICVLFWWQSSQRQITLEDVLIYLVILPLAVLAGFLVFQWLRARPYKDKPPALAAAMSSDTVKQDSAAAAQAAVTELPVLAAWGITSAGSRLNDFHTALVEKRQRPQPDAGLLNDYGYPVHTARVPDLETSFVESGLESIMADNPQLARGYDDTGRDGFLRVLALLKLLIDQLSAEWPLRDSAIDAPGSHNGIATLRGTELAGSKTDSRLRLQLKFIIPADFTPTEQQLALSYLLQQTSVLPIDSGRLHIQMVPAGDEPATLLLAERFRAEEHLAPLPQALLLLACDSRLCPAIVERWQTDNRLFGNQAPQGLMPGEAAFAILCVNDKALALAAGRPVCTLQPVAHAKRAEPADEGRKAGHAALDSAVGTAIATAGISNQEIGAIACDTDHRSNRVLECIGTMLEYTPHLDAIDDRLSTNEICGHTGAASNAGGWVAGIAHVAETGRPVLLFNVSHAIERAAAVLLPVLDQPQV